MAINTQAKFEPGHGVQAADDTVEAQAGLVSIVSGAKEGGRTAVGVDVHDHQGICFHSSAADGGRGALLVSRFVQLVTAHLPTQGQAVSPGHVIERFVQVLGALGVGDGLLQDGKGDFGNF